MKLNNLLFLFICLVLVSCSSDEEEKFEKLGRKSDDINLKYPMANQELRRAKRGRILLGGGSFLGGNRNIDGEANTDVKGGVNKYLWQASLEVLSFMPLTSADAIGGVIITDWYEDKKNERIKANVLINSTDLRASGVAVTLFKQVYSGGRWVNSKVSKETETIMEDKILSRAREIRLQGDTI
ncbi:MAG: DUF3576 domain-containing protein [Rickettsiales bacterium]|nr:DUF3576 domain-containing protein [Rickettsiales bacterium]